MSQDVTIRPVVTKQDKTAFLNVPFAIYGARSNWVAPLFFERFEHLDPRKNPYFKHAEAQLFLAEIGGKPVGRISAQIDQLHLERYHDATGQFGFLEAIDNRQVFAKLLDAAQNWLRARGMKRSCGPFSFSINDETGLLIDGFDTKPNMMMGHAQPYYRAQLEALGYAKAKDVIAYYLDDRGDLPPALAKAYERAMRSPDISVRPLSKKNLERDLAIILDIHTDAWSNNWGFIPFTRDELKMLGDNLKLLVKEEYIAIANYKGTPAAMAVTLPNINTWIDGLNGRLLPLGWARLAYKLFATVPTSIRMPLMGVRREFHGSLTGSALALAVIETVRRYHIARGTHSGELSWILEDNMAMRRIIEALGAKPYKTYRVFAKSL
jgi:hypothetical protein